MTSVWILRSVSCAGVSVHYSSVHERTEARREVIGSFESTGEQRCERENQRGAQAAQAVPRQRLEKPDEVSRTRGLRQHARVGQRGWEQ